MTQHFFSMALLLSLSQSFALTAMADKPDVETVLYVDLKSYMGVWNEYAAIPNFFERKCVLNTQAEYSFTQDGQVSVKNSCYDADGNIQIAEGVAKVVDTQSNSKLKVTFARIFGKWIFTPGGDYWIIDLGPNYEYALIGSPDRSYSWILSRTPQLERSVVAKLAEKLKSQGFNPCDLKLSPQKGGNSEAASLCTLL